MDALQATYEKTALHRMGIPMALALERVSWLRAALDGSTRRRKQQPAAKPARAAVAR